MIQLLFLTIAAAWTAYVAWTFFFWAIGECAGDYWCQENKELEIQVIFWRGLCVAIAIATAYRLLRKDADV